MAIALAAVTVLGVRGIVTAAQQSQRSWGRTVDVLVATADVAAGRPVDASNSSLVRRPARLVPRGALRTPVTAQRSRVDLVDGEVVVRSRLSGSGAVAARLGADDVGVTLDTGDGHPPVSIGDRVDVFVGSVDPAADGRGAGERADPELTARLVVAGATVIDHDDAHGDGRVTVAVRRDEAAALSAAALRGPVSLVLVP